MDEHRFAAMHWQLMQLRIDGMLAEADADRLARQAPRQGTLRRHLGLLLIAFGSRLAGTGAARAPTALRP